MVYTSLESPAEREFEFEFELRAAHLYADLMNAYGDNGNVLMLKYVGEKLGARMRFEIVSLGDSFDPDRYELAFWGGGQDYEQEIIARELSRLTAPLSSYIEAGNVLLAICGGYQMLGTHYVNAAGREIPTTGVLGHYTLNQGSARFIGDVEIHNPEFDETYYGFENHGGRTFLADNERPLGNVIYGSGNNGEDGGEGLHYKNTFGSYLHGPLLTRNPRLAYRIVRTALERKYPGVEPPAFEAILADEARAGRVADRKRQVRTG